MARNSRRRDNLLKRGNTCFWCGVTVVYTRVDAWPKGKMPVNFATVDHLYDRLTYPDRHETPPLQEERTVLACRACNQRRNRERQIAQAAQRRERRAQRDPSTPPVRSAAMVSEGERAA